MDYLRDFPHCNIYTRRPLVYAVGYFVMPNNLKTFVLLITLSLISACTNKEPVTEEPPQLAARIPVECKQKVKVHDIWKLEPMLIKSGKIQENMSKDEKETIIRKYIRKKNAQNKHCK